MYKIPKNCPPLIHGLFKECEMRQINSSSKSNRAALLLRSAFGLYINKLFLHFRMISCCCGCCSCCPRSCHTHQTRSINSHEYRGLDKDTGPLKEKKNMIFNGTSFTLEFVNII